MAKIKNTSSFPKTGGPFRRGPVFRSEDITEMTTVFLLELFYNFLHVSSPHSCIWAARGRLAAASSQLNNGPIRYVVICQYFSPLSIVLVKAKMAALCLVHSKNNACV